jgi:hypothetical protein
MRAAGLVDLVGLTDGKWMAGGVTPRGTDATSTDYCGGAAAVEHSHFFTADGRFGSYDENGNVVDDGTYAIQGKDTFVIGRVSVRFHIDATGHLGFLDITMADPCASADTDCRADHGWAISAFYPGDYERVGP